MVHRLLGWFGLLLLLGLLLGLTGTGCQTNPNLTGLAAEQTRPPRYSVGPDGSVRRLPDGEDSGIQQAQFQYGSHFAGVQDPFQALPAQAPVHRQDAAVPVPEPRKAPPPKELPPPNKDDRAMAAVIPPAEADVPPPGPMPLPTELGKVFMPCYIIEPPDVLFLEAVRLIPKGPYRVEPLDVLQINVAQTKAGEPIAGPFQVSPDGTVSLGFSYGIVRVGGLTLDQIADVIRKKLMEVPIANPQVSVGLVSFRGLQLIRGEHLVGQDGTINLGTYGCVNVVGLSLKQARYAIEKHLSQFLQDPQVSVQVAAYNSKVYYIITDGAGYGQSVFRVPYTGNETVLDAVSAIGGLPVVAWRRKIWVARPAPPGKPCYQVLPVDWDAITQAGQTSTNYQLFPGDRLFVQSDPLIRTDNFLAKLFAPYERILGAILLTNATIQSFHFNNNNNNNGSGFFVF